MEQKKDTLFSGNGKIGIREAIKQGTPLSRFCLERMSFRLSADEPQAGDESLPVRRDDVWQDMLRAVLGYVPEGAEHAPPCHCELTPIIEKCNFAELAGLPPAVRLMDGFFPVRDQSKRGSCFAFALVALCEYMLGKTVELSEQSLFHFTKLVTPGKIEDLGDGAIILDSIHAVEEYGICPLSEWHYNPESWNYVEDPYNEGQGKALQRKLAAAQKYRFRNWRTLSRGSVLQFKQALSSKFPIYTGVPVTTDWEDDEVRRTGVIPFPKLFWQIRVMAPPRGIVEKIMVENGIDIEDEESSHVAMKIGAQLIMDTLGYVASTVFKCKIAVLESEENEDGVELICVLDKIRGGHALCIAGYVDDVSYPGGGYFIARNSWSDVKWAPDSPEMPGYALIPYAYIATLGQEGVVMSEFPDVGGSVGVSEGGLRLSANFSEDSAGLSRSAYVSGYASSGNQISVSAAFRSQPFKEKPSSVDSGFDAWLARRSMVLDRPIREPSGILLRPETPVLVPDLSDPSTVMRDTPQNRAKMRKIYEDEMSDIAAAAEEKRRNSEKTAAENREKRSRKSLRETIDGIFSVDEYAVLPLAELKTRLLAADSDLAGIDELDCKIRACVIHLQKSDPGRYWFGHGFGGQEEIRPSGSDLKRIFV